MDDQEATNENSKEYHVQPVVVKNEGPPMKVQFLPEENAEAALYNTSVPTAYQNHPLIRNSYFYTVPSQLLLEICSPQGRCDKTFEFDEELLKMEMDLSLVSGDHGSRIGFLNNLPIQCNLMHTNLLPKEDMENSFNLNEEQIQDINRRLLSFSEISCGYAGWLMTNAKFLAELNALNKKYRKQMRRWGTALVGLPIPSFMPASTMNPVNEEGWDEYNNGVLEFCIRWRLRGLAGPRIPIPMQPMMSGQFPLSIVEQLMRAGGVFNWPDTYPLSARDELRDLLADALRPSDSSEHLAGWQQIIAPGNTAKNQIQPLERRFRFQHFWRLLQERHPAAFSRRLNRIELAFANYLGVKVGSIQKDRDEIKEKLGDGWDHAAQPNRPR